MRRTPEARIDRSTGCEILRSVRGLVVAAAVLAVLAAAHLASAAGSLTATVKAGSGYARVTIANHDTKAYNDFIVKATDSPKLLNAPKPCTLEHDSFTSGGKKHTDYRIECKQAVAPGKTWTVTLLTSGTGKTTVYASVHGVFTQVSP